MRTTVWIIQSNSGVLHSIWLKKEDAEKELDKLPLNVDGKPNWKVEEFLVRGT